ncbi:Glycerol-3-phosphate acyltransferase [bioreactor metagenome]|jgi:glycerol-3-phosphate acyltransferase PlsY|uniref:Glycerol-3-phosphate acyltransferase n=2 Tax=root TaxID=1 RepID=A0A4R8M8F3_9BACT|nr:glycerol-3-phosphate 1-O-acyltransferase PlsY [Aminivibrio pyruvatiphilus]MDD3514216.1 glycerol-3-phosphate 1-O-acyltransferase PlsY [Synergistaceae bacterium]TDY59886.1 glycerol-3-phosphate acyltransferase PlsY [Aminivibrio pyruvatiphilus]
MNSLFWIIFGYLAGSFPTGYLAARAVKGVDIRTFGSGNVGATNVGRLMGKKWAVAVTLADMIKASVGILCARAAGVDDSWTIAFTGFSGVCGHNFPLWLGFRGGKGVASTYGVVFFLHPPISFFLAPAGGIIWFALLKLKGYVSLASLISLWCLPVIAALLSFPLPFLLLLTSLAVLSTVRHRENILRLFEGKESSFKK